MDENKKLQDFDHVSNTPKSNGYLSHKRSISFKTNSVVSQQSSEQVHIFTSMPYVRGISKPKKCILTEVGFGVAIKPHFTLFSVFRKTKNPIEFEEKRGLVYQIFCRDCDAVYISKMERTVVLKPENETCLCS